MKLLLIIIAAMSVTTVCHAQISGIDATGYPTIRAYGSGPMFNNPKPSDFTVLENGANMNTSLKVQCSTEVKDPSLSVVLVIDKSESMNTPVGGGLQRIDWVKQGAKTFVQTLPFNKNTRVAVVSFDGLAYLECGFQSTPAPVIAAIDNIKVSGGATHFDKALLDPTNGAVTLLKSTPPWIRRMIVFLTDGLPNQNPQVQQITNQLVAEKIILHALFVTDQVSNELSIIAKDSGGGTYKANTQELINTVYRQLATSVATTVTYCWLEWQSPPICSDAARNKTVQITYRPTGARQTFSYIAPPNAVAGINVSSATLPPFPDIPPGNSSTQTVIISAINTDILVTSAQISPSANFSVSDWGGQAPPFLLTRGNPRTITIRFTQTAPRDIRTAQIIIQGSPCPSPIIKVTGGATKVSVLSPNGGEVYSTCDSVNVEWTGVDPADQVILHYNNGTSPIWNMLSTTATGLKYAWRNPPAITAGKIHLAAKTPRTDYSQPIPVAGTGTDSVAHASVHSSGSLLYFTGKFEKSATVGFPATPTSSPATISSPRNEEAFVAMQQFGVVRWAASGAVFLQPFGPFTLTRGIGVYVVEQIGEAWATGEIFRQSNGKHSVWLALFNTNGTTRLLREFSSTADIHVRRIGMDDSTKQLFLEGYYTGDFTWQLVNGRTIYLSSPTPKVFLALLDNNGRITHLQDKSYIKASPPVRDSLGNVYQFGAFRNSLSSADTTLFSKGNADGFVRKFGRVLTASDESDAPFSIQQPSISFTRPNVNVGSSNVGISSESTITGLLCNTRKVRAVVREWKFTGADSTDFSVAQPLLPIEIPPDSCIPVTITMLPPRIGKLQATLLAEGDCVQALIAVEGNGTLQAVDITNNDWNRKRIFTDNSGEVYLRNTGTTPVTVTALALKSTPESSFIPVFRQTPYVLDAGATDTIHVRFNPNDTAHFQNYVVATIAELSEPVQGLLNGFGFLPKLSASGYLFGAADVGSTLPETGRVRLHNPGNTTPTVIKKVEIRSNPGDFTFTLDTRQGFDIAQQATDSLALTVRFTPQATGRRTAVVAVYSDAAPGPDADPTVEDTVHIVGYGFRAGALDVQPLSFGNITACEQPVGYVVINNPEQYNVAITDIEILGKDSSSFSVPVTDTIVGAEGTISIPVQFKPDGQRSYTARLRFRDANGLVYFADISGEATVMTIEYALTPATFTYKPGEVVRVGVTANSTQKMPPSAQIECVISVDSKTLAFGRIADSSAAWTWFSTSGNDRFTLSGTPVANAFHSSGLFIAANFDAFLGESDQTELTLSVTNASSCVIPVTRGATMKLDPICLGSARFIRGGKQYYLRAPYPQPAEETVTLPIGVGLTGAVEVKIFDQLGRVVAMPVQEVMTEGEYEISLPTALLPAGIYTVMYTSGRYTENRTISVNK